MYRDLIKVAKQVLLIANERERKKDTQKTSIPLDNLLESLSNSGYYDIYDKKLIDILMALDFEQVLSLKTIMYLGRDHDCDLSQPSDCIFNDYKNYLKSLGTGKKEIEIEQMIEKTPLGRYLLEGYKILGINL